MKVRVRWCLYFLGSYNNLVNFSLKEINLVIIVYVDNLMIWYFKIIKIRNDDNFVFDKKKENFVKMDLDNFFWGSGCLNVRIIC